MTPASKPPLSREESFRACRRLTQHHAKSFYFSSHTLPREKREAAYAIYAYCRDVDDRVDLAVSAEEVTQALVKLREELTSRKFPAPWGLAFSQTVERYEIPWSYFEDLLVGVAMDQGTVRLLNWAELEKYCYHVASVVGLMMTHLFLKPTPEILSYAQHLGTAMQLTNILRDVAEDYARDRIYLPAEEMTKFGVTESDLADGRLTPEFRALLIFQVDRAREYYRRSEPGIRALPRDGSQLTVWMMREIYAGILEEIERVDYNVFVGRVRTTLLRKCQLAYRAWQRERGL